MSTSDPRPTWRAGYTLLLVVPFIGLLLNFGDPPRWLQITGVVLMVALVGVGARMLRRRAGGWRPSETLRGARDDARRPANDAR